MTEIGKRSDKAYLGSHSGRIWRELCREGREGEEGKREREAVMEAIPTGAVTAGRRSSNTNFFCRKRQDDKSRGPGRRGFRAKQRRLKGSPQQRRV